MGLTRGLYEGAYSGGGSSKIRGKYDASYSGNLQFIKREGDFSKREGEKVKRAKNR